jgi:hypothetical protein
VGNQQANSFLCNLGLCQELILNRSFADSLRECESHTNCIQKKSACRLPCIKMHACTCRARKHDRIAIAQSNLTQFCDYLWSRSNFSHSFSRKYTRFQYTRFLLRSAYIKRAICFFRMGRETESQPAYCRPICHSYHNTFQLCAIATWLHFRAQHIHQTCRTLSLTLAEERPNCPH